MLQALMNLLSLCWKPFGRGSGGADIGVIGSSFSGGGGREGKDGLLWFRDVGKYGSGDFSMAVVQANQVLEDQCQFESGPLGTFVGIYDGHGGPDASRYICDHLFRHFKGSSYRIQITLSCYLFNLLGGFLWLWHSCHRLAVVVVTVISDFHQFAFS